MLILILLSGAAMAYFRLHSSSPKHMGRQRWLWLMAAKVVLLIFLTPVLDMIVISWSGKVGQDKLTEPEIYFVRSVKFVLCLAAFALGLYSRIFREDVTLNFSVMPSQPQQ